MYILVLSYHLCLSIPSSFFSSALLSCYLPCPSHPWLIILIIFDEECKLWSSSLCISFQPHIISSLLGPNILLSTLFSKTFSLCSSLNVRRRSYTPIQNYRKVIVLCILIFIFLDSSWEAKKVLHWMVENITWISYSLNFLINQI
jgi:hypothetical protein